MPTQPLYRFNVTLRANKTLNSKHGQDYEKRPRNERPRCRQTGGGGMTRGETTTSQGGQATTATENEITATRGGRAKRGKGAVGWEMLAQHRRMIGGASDKEIKNSATIKQDT
jgi:hypothetical protein